MHKLDVKSHNGAFKSIFRYTLDEMVQIRGAFLFSIDYYKLI